MMRRNLKVLVIMLVMLAMIFVSCDNSVKGLEKNSEDADVSSVYDSDLVGYNVAFDLNGGKGYIREQYVEGGKIETSKVKIPTKDGYIFGGWINSSNNEPFNISTEKVKQNMVLKAVWKESFKVGDTGPGGGIIFYVAPETQTSTYTDGKSEYKLEWKYLEAASEDCNVNGTFTWGDSGSLDTKEGIGEGWSNTRKLMAKNGVDFEAVKASTLYGSNGFSDWFLPSKEELSAFCEYNKTHKDEKMIMSYKCRWSSSENGNDAAWAQSFDGGEPSSNTRYDGRWMARPIRAFK